MVIVWCDWRVSYSSNHIVIIRVYKSTPGILKPILFCMSIISIKNKRINKICVIEVIQLLQQLAFHPEWIARSKPWLLPDVTQNNTSFLSCFWGNTMKPQSVQAYAYLCTQGSLLRTWGTISVDGTLSGWFMCKASACPLHHHCRPTRNFLLFLFNFKCGRPS